MARLKGFLYGKALTTAKALRAIRVGDEVVLQAVASVYIPELFEGKRFVVTSISTRGHLIYRGNCLETVPDWSSPHWSFTSRHIKAWRPQQIVSSTKKE